MRRQVVKIFFFPFPITIRGHLSIVFFLFQYCTWFILCVRVCVCLRSGSGQKYSLIFLDFFLMWCLVFQQKKISISFSLFGRSWDTSTNTHTHTQIVNWNTRDTTHNLNEWHPMSREKFCSHHATFYFEMATNEKKKIKQDKKKTLKIST